MPLWEDFINSLKGAAKGIASVPGALIGNVAAGGAQFGAAQTFKGSPEAAAAAGIAAETGTQKSLQKAGLSTVQDTTAKVVDPVLYAASFNSNFQEATDLVSEDTLSGQKQMNAA